MYNWVILWLRCNCCKSLQVNCSVATITFQLHARNNFQVISNNLQVMLTNLVSVIFYSLSIITCRLSILICRLSVVICSLSVVICSLSVIICRFSVTAFRSRVITCQSNVRGLIQNYSPHALYACTAPLLGQTQHTYSSRPVDRVQNRSVH